MKARQPREEPPQSHMFADMLRQVRRVPRGRVATYGDIAYAAGYPGAARQVAWALHGASAGLPWHRIVGAGGTILLTGEPGFEQRLHLEAEGVAFLGLKVNMLAHRHSFSPKAGKKIAGKISAEPGAAGLRKNPPQKRARPGRG